MRVNENSFSLFSFSFFFSSIRLFFVWINIKKQGGSTTQEGGLTNYSEDKLKNRMSDDVVSSSLSDYKSSFTGNGMQNIPGNDSYPFCKNNYLLHLRI
ncbi:hypothetical protein CEXT_95301 [Caerostris extrusa]|uniref:Uncharacterized protein n=1 Tax=Caerostris extrusa TaxID=172846 RepID=A0AAV4W4Z6_CAEEX|nr:hypothetical protein CEXT_95301 [Caerostris extrusa]